MVTARANSYAIAAGDGWYAGLPRPSPVTGVWQLLSVASHMRVLPVVHPSIGGTYSPQLTDAASASSVAYVPFKAWQTPLLSDNGRLYYFGGMHSDYPGNDMDRCDLTAIASSAMTWAQLHRPRVPDPTVDTVAYAGGGGTTIYKQYTPALADKTDWQPNARHYYCGQMWHPTLQKVVMQAQYPVDPATGLYSTTTWPGTGLAKSSLEHWGGSDGRAYGMVTFDPATLKYGLLTPGLSTMNLGSEWHLSDFCSLIDGFLVWETALPSLTKIYECSTATGNALSLTSSPTQAESGLVGNSSSRQEGTVIRWMGGYDFAVLHKHGDTGVHTLKKYDHTAGLSNSARFTNIPLPSGIVLVSGGNLAIAVDRSGNRLFLAEFQAATTPRFWVCTFDQLGTWTALSFTSTPTPAWPSFPATGSLGREPLLYWNNQLFLIDVYSANSRVRWYRVALDGGPV